MVLPGFVRTEGFPATELREKALTRWIVSKPEKVAEAIYECGPAARPSATSRAPTRSPRSLRILAPRWSAASSAAAPPRASPPAPAATERQGSDPG